MGADAIKPLMDNIDNAVIHLKKSVNAFERFDTRFAQFKANTDAQNEEVAGRTAVNEEQEVELTLIKQKLFVDEFFDPTLGNGEVIKKDWKHYDVRDNMSNEAFLA